MTFTPEQTAELKKPLDPAHVASRKQGSAQVSYVEGWHVIAEANRIFGFDGWTRETDEIRCVAEFPRKIGVGTKYEKDGWSVTYTTRVRIRVGDVTREGCGAGHGIDADKGQAHESAIKEAETDAMKRALMTFGNPFGLALYDKSKANVQAPAPPPPEYITDDQRDVIATMAQAAGMDLRFICESYKIQSLKELPASKFDALMKRLQQVIDDKPKQKEAA